MSVTLVLGGARSGKSRFAQRLALELSAAPVYVATSRLWDAEHGERIRRHREERGPEWTTLEEPRCLSRLDLESRVVVVDCVTLWLNNFFDAATNVDVDDLVLEMTREFDATIARPNTWLFVSNEIGQGVHASTELGRRFTDAQGFVNQHIAARADGVVWMVAGLPVVVKGALPGSGSDAVGRVDRRLRGDAS